MTPYRERLTAPVSWWLAAAGFAVVWGWLLLVVSTWPIAIGTALLVAALGIAAVQRYGSLLVAVDDTGLRVGRATIDPAHVGQVQPLNRVEYRLRLGTGADARAFLATRPYVDRGVMVGIDDPSDPVPYWLVSSRHPEALAAALGHTGSSPTGPDPIGPPLTDDALPTAARDTNGDTPRGEEA